jgi:hypothetical protein
VKLSWRTAIIVIALSIFALVPVLQPAQAIGTVCLADSESEGFDGVFLKGVTRAETTQEAPNTWDDWLWRGDPFPCPPNVKRCEYSYGKSHTASTTFGVGGLAQFGNRNSPSKSFLNAFLFIIPNYTKVEEYTTNFSDLVAFRPGDTAYPIQVATRRWRSGIYRGGYFKLTGADACLADGGGSGHWYVRYHDRPWGSWSDNYLVKEWSSYVVNGKVGEPFNEG